MATQSACDMDKNENVPKTVSWENGYNSLQILPLPCTNYDIYFHMLYRIKISKSFLNC